MTGLSFDRTAVRVGLEALNRSATVVARRRTGVPRGPQGRRRMQPLSGTVQRYDWGTNDAIPALLGRPADDRPVAEYWLGAHSSSPSLLGSRTLVEHIGAVPAVLGRRSREAFGEHLPYLMKVLSARHALSIQAHPSREQ